MVKVRLEIIYRSDSISLFLQQLIAHVDTPSETVSIFLSKIQTQTCLCKRVIKRFRTHTKFTVRHHPHRAVTYDYAWRSV